jgi:uncharacterized protein YfaS (alpha-2-macroglobulin family)
VSTQDIYRLARAFVDPFIASDPQPPAVIVLDLDHSEDPTHGQQECSFYNHYDGHHCYLPLFLFEGLSGQFITAALRPGKRPTGQAAPATLDFAWPTGRQPLSVNHQGAGRPWALIQSRAAIPLKEPLFTGYAIQRTVIPVEQRQSGVWSRGDVARVRLDINAQADMSWVVVNDPVPTGASILGTGFGGDSQILTRGEQRESWMQPTFEERRFDAFRAYYEFAPKGRWTMEYTVRFNNAGHFELPPTRVEALYLPEMFGEWPNAMVEVAAGE